jgi:hypothetical protein
MARLSTLLVPRLPQETGVVCFFIPAAAFSSVGATRSLVGGRLPVVRQKQKALADHDLIPPCTA